MQLFNRVFDRQAMAVPARDVLRVKPGELARFDNHVFQDFVNSVADVQFAVGVGRAIVQDKQGCALARDPQALVQPGLVPMFDPARLALGQVAAHGEGRVRQVQGLGIVGGVGHGCLKKIAAGAGQKAWQADAPGVLVSLGGDAGPSASLRAPSNSGRQPGSGVIAVLVYAAREGFQALVFQFIV